MAKKLKFNRGISLIEVVVVMALVGMIVGVLASTNTDAYRAYSLRNERDTLVNTLQRARIEAMNNVCIGTCVSTAHGVRLEADKYTLFQGASYASRDATADEVTQLNGAVKIIEPVTLPFDAVFNSLSGDLAVGSGDIKISDNTIRASVITLTSVGQIIWTN